MSAVQSGNSGSDPVVPLPPRVVVVGTVEAAAAWVAAIRQAGKGEIVATAAPFARVTTPRDPSRVAMALGSRRHELVLATSSNAVRFVAADVGFGRAAAAVGAKTAKALRDRGFVVDVQGDAGAESLARMIVASGPPRSVLWLRGERAREEGVEILRAAGFAVDEVESYRTEPVPEFAATIRTMGTPSAWVLGSPAAVEALVGAGGLSVPAPCVAVGETTAAALRAAGVRAVAVAAEPTPEAIASAVAEICRPR